MQKISGIEISKEIIERLKGMIRPDKAMVAVLIGDDPISANFVNEKRKIANELGIKFKIYNFSEGLNNQNLREEINKIARDENVGGVIVQLPLPQSIDRHEILKDIPANVDVDVLGAHAVAEFYMKESGVLPPSCGVVEEICNGLNVDLAKSKVAIVGLGLLIGKPIAIYMTHRAKETMLFANKSDLVELQSADIIISGVGKANLILPEKLKKNAVVIDFGYDYSAGKLVGDFDHTNVERLINVSHYTPTPGGTGPILVAKLFENFYKLNNKNG